MAKILIVDDEPKLGRLLVEMLEGQAHEVHRARGGKEALALVGEGGTDLVVSDLRMPEVDGMTVLRETRRRSPGTDVILMTAFASTEGAVEAMREGAADYLIKPFATDEFRLRVGRLLERRQLSARADQLARRLDAREGFGRIVAESRRMRALLDQAQRVAATDETVLLLGESGTGKSLLARAIHHGSARAGGPLVEVHSAALPETLLESELFGRDKGAFTGATESKRGHVEAAAGGTLFLDEIGELPLAMQVKLLRFLQERTFVRLGSTEERRADVRVIAATNRDLDAAVKEGRFRQDLYYRLAVFPLVMPPLRERPEDIRATAAQLLARRGLGADRLTDAALAALARHAWPGNVRELENALSRALVLAGTDPIGPEHLPAATRGPVAEGAPAAPAPTSTGVLDDLLVPGFQLDAFESDLIQQAIVKAGGNKAQAARLLGVTRRRLYSLLESAKRIDERSDDPSD